MTVVTSNLRPYKMRNLPQLSDSLVPFLSQEHQAIQNSIGQLITAIQQLGAAWTPYTPTVTPNSGAFTTVSTSGRFLQVGKTVFVNIDVFITTNGTAAGFVSVSLPVSSLGNYILAGRETIVGKMLQGSASGANAAILNYDNTYPGGDNHTLVISGVYEAA